MAYNHPMFFPNHVTAQSLPKKSDLNGTCGTELGFSFFLTLQVAPHSQVNDMLLRASVIRLVLRLSSDFIFVPNTFKPRDWFVTLIQVQFSLMRCLSCQCCGDSICALDAQWGLRKVFLTSFCRTTGSFPYFTLCNCDKANATFPRYNKWESEWMIEWMRVSVVHISIDLGSPWSWINVMFIGIFLLLSGTCQSFVVPTCPLPRTAASPGIVDIYRGTRERTDQRTSISSFGLAGIRASY